MVVNKCLLCLEYPTIPGPKFLEIFGDEGQRLNISAIINKHFWLKTNRNSDYVQKVCMTCWEVVRDFHILYERVEDVHKHLEVKTIVIDDPLPQDVMLKSEDYNASMAQDPFKTDNCMPDDSLFDSEVKVEVNDLDLLPQIEILETEERPTRTNRRGRPSTTREQSPKTSTKRIKREQSPANDKDLNLDVFGEPEPFINDALNSSGSLEDINKSLLTTTLDISDDKGSKKRGRPRRGVDSDKPTKATTTPRTKRSKKQQQQEGVKVKNEKENDNEENPTCSTSTAAAAAGAQSSSSTVAQIKTETSGEEVSIFEQFAKGDNDQYDDDAYAHDDDNDNGANDNDDTDDDDDNYQKNSDDTSDDEFLSDGSNASDWGESNNKKEKFAVIKKKERNTPKKYKKREKPAVEPKRMSREEIEARQAQQAEYDNIITKFFEKLRCPKCELLVHTFGDMRAHFRTDHNDDHGFIECCGRRFATRKFLAEHVMVHYNPEHFKCKTCEKVCRDSTQLEAHELTHMPNPPPSKAKKTFQCEKCSKTFVSKASFEHHMVAKHVPREEFKFECPECKKKLPSEGKLREHMHSHDSTKRQICDKCGKTFKNNYNMKKHEESEHSDIKPEPANCTICNTWYRNESGLKTHMKNMHDNVGQEHRCNICNKVSTTNRALKRHIYLNHKCEKKFKCNMCEKAFKRGQDLREHISVHTGEALYTCPSCPMTFASSANMYKHRQRLHKAEYAAYKQQAMPPNIIKQAKSGGHKIRINRRFIGSTDSETHEHFMAVLPESGLPDLHSNSLINTQIMAATHFAMQ